MACIPVVRSIREALSGSALTQTINVVSGKLSDKRNAARMQALLVLSREVSDIFKNGRYEVSVPMDKGLTNVEVTAIREYAESMGLDETELKTLLYQQTYCNLTLYQASKVFDESMTLFTSGHLGGVISSEVLHPEEVHNWTIRRIAVVLDSNELEYLRHTRFAGILDVELGRSIADTARRIQTIIGVDPELYDPDQILYWKGSRLFGKLKELSQSVKSVYLFASVILKARMSHQAARISLLRQYLRTEGIRKPTTREALREVHVNNHVRPKITTYDVKVDLSQVEKLIDDNFSISTNLAILPHVRKYEYIQCALVRMLTTIVDTGASLIDIPKTKDQQIVYRDAVVNVFALEGLVSLRLIGKTWEDAYKLTPMQTTTGFSDIGFVSRAVIPMLALDTSAEKGKGKIHKPMYECLMKKAETGCLYNRESILSDLSLLPRSRRAMSSIRWMANLAFPGDTIKAAVLEREYLHMTQFMPNDGEPTSGQNVFLSSLYKRRRHLGVSMDLPVALDGLQLAEEDNTYLVGIPERLFKLTDRDSGLPYKEDIHSGNTLHVEEVHDVEISSWWSMEKRVFAG